MQIMWRQIVQIEFTIWIVFGMPERISKFVHAPSRMFLETSGNAKIRRLQRTSFVPQTHKRTIVEDFATICRTKEIIWNRNSYSFIYLVCYTVRTWRVGYSSRTGGKHLKCSLSFYQYENELKIIIPWQATIWTRPRGGTCDEKHNKTKK